MPKPNLVRVKLPDGQEATVGVSLAKTHGLEVVDKTAADKTGAGRRSKPRTSIADAVESKKNTRKGSVPSASSEEEIK